MRNEWRDDAIRRSDAIDQLIYQARIIGQEDSLVLWGGGNTSFKFIEHDFNGKSVRVMCVKGSGSDMKATTRRDFPAVRLDDLIPLFDRDDLSDDVMVECVMRALVDPSSPRPSIETLLHAFVPFDAVLHTHADALLTVMNTRGREATVRNCFGDDMLTVPYRRPGFLLSKETGLAIRANPNARGLLLMNHGLVTWGDTPKQAYDRHIELVTQAEEYVNRNWSIAIRQSEFIDRQPTIANRPSFAEKISPLLRGALGKERRVVIRFDDGDGVMNFLQHPDAKMLVESGAATPDHTLYTKRNAAWADIRPLIERNASAEEIANEIRNSIHAFALRDNDFFDANRDSLNLSQDDLRFVSHIPRVILAPGIGMWTVGKDARAAKIASDVFHHTISIMLGANALGGYASLSQKDALDIEYWPMELYRLSLQPAERELSRRVALVTGAANGIGKAVALRLAKEGAHVIVADIDLTSAQAVADEIVAANGIDRAIAIRMNVTDEASVLSAFAQSCLAYGGVDIVVSNAGIARTSSITDLTLDEWNASLSVNATGHFLVAREAMRVMKSQGTGGSIVFNATKNVTAPGKDFGAYSASKAAEAQLCRVVAIEGGEYGIRANMVNPDAIFNTNLWTDQIRQSRAKAAGIDVGQLEAHYAKRNLLQTKVTAEDVAEAIFWLASDRSSKTTGAMIPIDGGLRESFPR